MMPSLRRSSRKPNSSSPSFPPAPRVYYFNLPQKWIAGAVYDPQADICLQGATVTATNQETTATSIALTDNYGDFWLKNLSDGIYTLRIEAEGYQARELGPVDASLKDQNLGDIALQKV
jgi:tetrathionate reductase subunit B